MAKRFTTTAQHVCRPLTLAAAFAAGLFPTADLFSQQQPQVNPDSKLHEILNEKDHRFSEIPLVSERSATGRLFESTAGRERPVATSQPTGGPAAQLDRQPLSPGVSAAKLLQDVQQANDDRRVQARVLVNNEVLDPQANAQTWQAPRLKQEAADGQVNVLPASATRYEAMQTNYQSPVQPQSDPGTTINQSSIMPASAASRETETMGVHQLKNISMQAFENEVVSIWGNRLKTSSSPDGRYVRVTMPSKIDQDMVMLVDRKTGQLSYEGSPQLLDNWHNLLQTIDQKPRATVDGFLKAAVVDRNNTSMETIRQVVHLMGYGSQDQDPAVGDPVPAAVQPGGQVPAGNQDQDNLKGTVKILQDPETGSITIVGDADDVAIIARELQQLSQQALENQPRVETIELTNVQGSQLAERVQEIYDASYEPIHGAAQIIGIDNPNGLLVVAQPTGIDAVRLIAEKLDVESDVPAGSDFKVFTLKHISANDARYRLTRFYGQAQPLGEDTERPVAPVEIISDFRSNLLFVRGPKQYIKQAEAFLAEIDVDKTENGPVNVVKVIPLQNAVAADVASIVQNAVNGGQQNAQQQAFSNGQQQGQQGQLGQQQPGIPSDDGSTLGSPQLQLQTIGSDGRLVEGGIMFEVRISADANSNSVIVNAPAASIELIEELIKQLDRIPDANIQLKVFTLVHGDAQLMLTTLQNLFQSNQTQQGGFGQQAGGFGNAGNSGLQVLPLQSASQSDGQSLATLRFSVDLRSNSIIVSGPTGDLEVIEALIERLDSRTIDQMETKIYRLSNAPVADVAEAIQSLIQGRVDILGSDPRFQTGVPNVNRQILLQPEINSNSLIVKALPEYIGEVERIVQALDRRPPMVKVKALIAEVNLGRIEEFGVELGLQDSLLFDRGTSIAAGGALTGVGFPFNASGAPTIATSANANAFARELLAPQALTNYNVNSSDAGYQGFSLSAGNESISVLLRALKDKQCLRVLSKPQIMTMENLQGRVAVGASVPRIAGTTQTNVGVTQDIVFQDVGVILAVTPRVSPDGVITLRVDMEKSSVGNTVGATGAQAIIKTEAQTTLMARSGQTVVFSGLIEEEKEHNERGAPILSELPGIGPLFKYETDQASRREILIIMTPYLVTNDQDISMHNNDEIDRVNWCLSDVAEVYGSTDYSGQLMPIHGEVETVYPDLDPTGTLGPRVLDSRLQTPEQPRLSDVQIPVGQGGTMQTDAGDVQQDAAAGSTPTQTAEGRTRRGIFSRRR